jgi:hypothetical protein
MCNFKSLVTKDDKDCVSFDLSQSLLETIHGSGGVRWDPSSLLVAQLMIVPVSSSFLGTPAKTKETGEDKISGMSLTGSENADRDTCVKPRE